MTMEAELKILSLLGEDDANVTQRDLSAKTELSLGAVNLLLKKMLEKGLIKIERLSTRTVRYMLTPKGMMEKAKKTYDFVKRTYENILLMKHELTLIVREIPKGGTLCLHGAEDEVYRMVVMLLGEMIGERDVVLEKCSSLEGIPASGTVIVWDDVLADKPEGVRCVNILDRIL